jgi:hypothetical protein
MASTIKIKRSLTSAQPGTLAPGELAYSGGLDKLYIGMGWTDPTQAVADSVVTIGGQYYTSLLEGTPGTWTSSKALIVGSNGKVDQVKVGDITLSTKTITTSTTNTDLELDANGTGLIKLYPSSNTDSWYLPRSSGNDGQFLKIDGTGHATWADVPVNLSVDSDSGSGVLNLIDESFTINGAKGVTTSFNDTTNILTVSGIYASSSAVGVASFDDVYFTFDTSGGGNKIGLVNEKIQDIAGNMVAGSLLNKNITVTYDDDANAVKFEVSTASTDAAGVAQFDSDFFKFTTGADSLQSKVQLVGSIIKTVSVGGTDLTITDNTLRFTSGTGISLTSSQGTITVSGVNATANTKGIALFGESYFDMTIPGEVKIKPATAGDAQTGQLGLSKFDTANFTVADGLVTAKTVKLGGATLVLGANPETTLDGLEIFEAGTVHIENNTISSTSTAADLTVKAGAGKYVVIGSGNDYWKLPQSKGTGNDPNEVLTINKTTGIAEWRAPKADVSIYDDTGINPVTLTVGTSSITYDGVQGIGTTVTKNGDMVTLQISGVLATASTVGVAKFNSTEFEIQTGGDVHLRDGGIAVSKLQENTVQIGSTTVELGQSTNILEGLDYVEAGNVKIGIDLVANPSATAKQKSTIAARTGAGGGNLYLEGTGSGKVWISSAYALPNVDGLSGQSLITDGNGTVRWATPTTVLKFQGDQSDNSTDVTGSVDLINGTLKFLGVDGAGIYTTISDSLDTVKIGANIATYSSGGDIARGIASFDSNHFTVTSGAVSLAEAGAGKGIPNSKLINSFIRIGDQTINLGDPFVTTLSGVTGGIEAGNLGIGLTGTTNTIKALNTNGDVTINTNGTGVIRLYGQGSYSWTLPDRGTNNSGKVLTMGSGGTTTWETPVTILQIAGNTGTDNINLIDDVLTFDGGIGLSTTITNNKVTIDADIASDTTVGVAKFFANQFTVSGAGSVTLKDTGIQDIVGAMLTGTGSSQTNIEVHYNQPDGKLQFAVPDATYTTPGVAAFYANDFMIDSSGIVSLDGAVLKGITTDGGIVTPVNNSISLKGNANQGVTVNKSGTDITVTVATATASTLGVASFPTAQFSLSNGAVTIKDATDVIKGVASFASKNFNVVSGGVTTTTQFIGDQTIDLGGDKINELTGLDTLKAGDITISSNTIAYTGNSSNGSINLTPTGTGSVALGGKKITNLATPSNASDAATKEYVDGKASGLTVKDPVRLASGPDAPNTPNAHGVDSVGKVTLSYTVSSTSTSNFPIIDGRQVALNDRVLLKNQGTADPNSPSATDSAENGIYVWKDNAGTAGWARASDADQDTELSAGTFLFVQDGELWADTGWVLQTLWNPSSMNIDTDPLKFVQFSAAGVLKVDPNGGLYKTGGYFGINLDSTSGLEVNGSNVLALKATVAGDGLTITNGVIAVGGTTDRITVTANAVDIASTYVGQTSITTLGTIATGTWNGNAVGAAYGGTGRSSFNKGDLLVGNSSNGLNVLAATNNAGKFLQVNAAGDDVVYGDIDGGIY